MPAKIWVPLLVILASVGWLVFSNVSSANYFFNVNELDELGDRVYDINLRVKGRVVPGSIKADVRPVVFVIAEEGHELTVHYTGTEPLPDMFKDRAEAVVEGRMGRDNIFKANHLQAKCASKYEAAGPDMTAEYGAQPAEKPVATGAAATP